MWSSTGGVCAPKVAEGNSDTKGAKSTGGAGTICYVSSLLVELLQPVYFTTMESSTLQLGFPA